MKTALAVLGLAVLLSACNCACPDTDPACNAGVGGSGGGGTGGSGGGGVEVYDVYTLDTTFSDRFYMDLVVDKTRNRVGVAYFAGRGEIPIIYGDGGLEGGDGLDAGSYAVKYVEWEDGTAQAPQNIAVVRRLMGISVDFHPTTGEPAVAYLGGGSDMSVFWHNSDAELAVRSGGSTWTTTIVADNGSLVVCGNPVSDNMSSTVVGVWPAIGYESNGNLWYCYRDVHTGQYPLQDWAGSDVECVRGAPGSWTRDCTYPGGNTKNAPGGRIDLTVVNDRPVIVWDQAFGGADTTGQNVWMQERSDTAWSNIMSVFTVNDTQSGASVAYDPQEGHGVAVLDLYEGVLRYTNRLPGSGVFSAADPVFGEGTGGWYPSLAMDPMFHEPAIAYYVCSATSGVGIQMCSPSFDEVRVSQRVSGNWRSERVDTVTASTVRLGFFGDGRKVIAYRETNGTVKLAVRKVP